MAFGLFLQVAPPLLAILANVDVDTLTHVHDSILIAWRSRFLLFVMHLLDDQPREIRKFRDDASDDPIQVNRGQQMSADITHTNFTHRRIVSSAR